LTGELYVDLDFYPGARREVIAKYGEHEVIPTLPTQLEALTTKITNILNKLDAIPLDQISQDLSQTAAGANALMNAPELKQVVVELEATLSEIRATAAQLNGKVAPELANALKQSSAALKSANAIMSDRSPVYTELQRMLQEVSTAARSVRLMADYLERHPEALLQGKGKGR